jgi:hypothetical protein
MHSLSGKTHLDVLQTMYYLNKTFGARYVNHYRDFGWYYAHFLADVQEYVYYVLAWFGLLLEQVNREAHQVVILIFDFCVTYN